MGIPTREPRKKKKVNAIIVMTGSGLERLHLFEQFEDSNSLHIFLSEGKIGGRVCKESRNDYNRELKSLIHAPVIEYQQCAGRTMSDNAQFSDFIEPSRKKERNSCFLEFSGLLICVLLITHIFLKVQYMSASDVYQAAQSRASQPRC